MFCVFNSKFYLQKSSCIENSVIDMVIYCLGLLILIFNLELSNSATDW